MSISTKQLAATGWKRTNPGATFASYEHEAGWHLDHCGHPTANYPYSLYDPTGKWTPAPNGKNFQNVQKAVEWLASHLNPELIPNADSERADALAEAQREEMERTMRSPLANLSAAAGEMERESPLFFGTGNNPTLF